MEDYIIRATAANHQIRAFAATTRELVEYGRQVHDLSPVAAAALGRLLTAGTMMGAMLKGEKDILTLQIKCSGPIKGLTVTADSRSNVKGYVNKPDVMLPPNGKGKLDVGGALDRGVLSVIKDMGMKEPYIGQTQLVSGEIAEDLTYYFASSEQVPSSVALGVLMNKNNTVKRAGGFIIQLMPFAEEDVIAGLEKKISQVTSITSLLDQELMPEDILKQVLGGFGLEVLDAIPASYHCDCCRERVLKAVASVGRKELNGIIRDNKPIEVNCHFCGKSYEIGVEEFKTLVKNG